MKKSAVKFPQKPPKGEGMNATQTKKFQKALQKKQEELASKQRVSFQDLRSFDVMPSDIADKADLAHLCSKTATLHSSNGNLLQLVEKALGKITAGEYGICEECEDPISEKRLTAVPWARLCVSCQQAIEERTGRTAKPMTDVYARA
jgi:DnaK suppressor protein